MPGKHQPTPLVTIGLDDIAGERGPFDEDGEPSSYVTIRDLIVEAATRQIVGEIGKDIRKQVETAVREQIVEQSTQVIADALAKPFRKTNTWGDPTGPETSISGLIGEQVQDWLTKAESSYDRGGSPFRKLLAEEVGKAMRAELTDTIKAARAKVEAVVKDNAAQLIANAVKDSTR